MPQAVPKGSAMQAADPRPHHGKIRKGVQQYTLGNGVVLLQLKRATPLRFRGAKNRQKTAGRLLPRASTYEYHGPVMARPPIALLQ